MREKCGIGGINNMGYFTNPCRYCGEVFIKWDDLMLHELYCVKSQDNEKLKQDNIKPTHYNKGKKDLIEIEIKIKDEELKRHVELLEALIEVQKQEFYKAIEEILEKP